MLPHNIMLTAGRMLLTLGLVLGMTLPITRADENTAESEYTPQQIEKAFLALRQGANDRTVEKSTRIIEEAGKDAFPILVKYLNSKTAADQRHFKSEIWEIDPKTHYLRGRRPVTLGELAFQFLQNAIEEDFPREFKIFQILTPKNIASWIDNNKFLSLYEMRSAAAAEALTKAEALHKQEPSEHTADAVRYMKNLVARYSQR